MQTGVDWTERHQVPLYLAALLVGVVAGGALPGMAHPAEVAITPILGVLLYATFLGVPVARIGQAVRDWRFLATVTVVNFGLVPLVVWCLSRIVAHDQALLVGVLFVLLAPCVDYVIVFTGIAGGAKDRLLAATPLLMLGQMLALPLFLSWFVGSESVAAVDFEPFAGAFLLLIVLPLIAAWTTQFAAARTRIGRALRDSLLAAMVPLVMLTLAVVVASQISSVSLQLGNLLPAILVFVVFAAIMLPVGVLAGRITGLDVPGARAVAFSGATRNSLVVLPLVLALPVTLALAPLVVVTQTLVELLVMLVFVRLVPRIIRSRADSLRAETRLQ